MAPPLSLPRFTASVAAALLAAVVVVGAVAIALGGGASAYTVDSRAAEQGTVDDELAILADHPEFASGIVAQQVEPKGGSLPASATSGWLTIRIVSDIARRELARRDARVTADDLASTNLDGQSPFEALPADFRAEVKSRLASVRALQRVLADEDPDAVLEQARGACASERYVSHILVATLAEAQALEAQLDGGADFAELAASSSTDSSGADGGALGCLTEDAFVEPFQTVATTQELDVVSDPVQTEFGFHLILVTDDPPQAEIDAATIQAVFEIVRRVDVDLDPRYGSWNRDQGQVLVPKIPAG